MTIDELLGIVLLLAIIATIGIECYKLRYSTYLRPKKKRSGDFFDPYKYPEKGEDEAFCDLCHGRLGPDKLAYCICGNRFHPDCAGLQDCPRCGNDLRHMRIREPFVARCPVCIRRAPGGYCSHCSLTIPRKDGTFKCHNCGTVVFTAHPRCRKCGKRYLPRTTKGYMNKVRSRR